jgi:biotin carboxylase
MKSKKLIILGGNPETASFVEYLNELGIYTIVIDPNKNAPAKRICHESHDVDCLDTEKLITTIKALEFDGIIVGVADILVTSYLKVCKIFKVPCYANENTIRAFGSKDGFIAECRKYGIDVTPCYEENDLHNIKNHSKFLVKPVDNGAGVGMSICNSKDDLRNAIDYAKLFSKSKRVLIEKYMDCDDMFAYYTFSNGKIYLSATADRYKTRMTDSGSPVCIGAKYPSIYQDEFEEKVDPLLRKMFKGLKINNGILNIQFFKDDDGFYAYDPGFRLQGEAPHLHILHALGLDQRKLLSDFALSEQNDSFDKKHNKRFVGDNIIAITAWVLLKEGVISNIQGLEKIKNLKSFKECVQRLFIGDKVTSDMIDTEKQVFARFYFQSSDPILLKKDLSLFSNILEISSKNLSMISDIFDTTYID